MAYSLDSSKVQLVTVNGRIAGQQIINRFWYAYQGVLPNPDTPVSTTFLTQFQTIYRSAILASYYSVYTVFSYEMKELDDVALIAAGPPARYKNSFNVSKLDLLLGSGGDIGALAIAGGTQLPTHEVMRIAIKPTFRALGFFKGSYVRSSGGFVASLLDPAAPETWTAGTVAAYQANWSGLLAQAIWGVGVHVGSGFFIGQFSTNYFGRVIKPGGGDLREACAQATALTVNKWVGTQTTRRFTPGGSFRGK